VKAEDRARRVKEFDVNEKKVKTMKEWINKYQTNEGLSGMAAQRKKELEKMVTVEAVEDEKTFAFKFFPVDKLPNEVALLRVINMNFSYKKEAKVPLLNQVNIHADLTSRIGLMGMNGTGKTTLLKLIKGELTPDAGVVRLNEHARIATFSQHHMEQLDGAATPVSFFLQQFTDMKEQEARNHLGALGVSGDLALQRMSTLSGMLHDLSNPSLLIIYHGDRFP
jgi:ATP-binding cassette subfamily F protein 3